MQDASKPKLSDAEDTRADVLFAQIELANTLLDSASPSFALRAANVTLARQALTTIYRMLPELGASDQAARIIEAKDKLRARLTVMERGSSSGFSSLSGGKNASDAIVLRSVLATSAPGSRSRELR